MIYLDNNSTTRVDPAVAGAMYEWMSREYGNTSSQHSAGRRAHRIVEDAREAIAAMLGAELAGTGGDRLVFTSGGTESNNLAIKGLVSETLVTQKSSLVLTSPLEHPSVLAPIADLQRRGWRVRDLAVRPDGVVDYDQSDVTTEQCGLLCCMFGNHETGVLQPAMSLAHRAQASGIPFHCDAVQAVGKVAIDFQGLDVSTLSFSAHKFHGPCGIGGLLIRRGATLLPQLFGGFQQMGLRPGTEPVALVVGMRKALEMAIAKIDETKREMEGLREELETHLVRELPDVKIHGAGVPRLPHVTNVAFRNVDRQALVMALDLKGIAVSTGTACQSGSSEPSPVLRAMGVSDDWISGAIRISLSRFTTRIEIIQAAETIVGVVKRLGVK